LSYADTPLTKIIKKFSIFSSFQSVSMLRMCIFFMENHKWRLSIFFSFHLGFIYFAFLSGKPLCLINEEPSRNPRNTNEKNVIPRPPFCIFCINSADYLSSTPQ